MKAFKQIMNERYPPSTMEYDIEDVSFQTGLELGWRAALEWVLTLKRFSHTAGMQDYDCIDDFDIGTIEDELNDIE